MFLALGPRSGFPGLRIFQAQVFSLASAPRIRNGIFPGGPDASNQGYQTEKDERKAFEIGEALWIAGGTNRSIRSDSSPPLSFQTDAAAD